MSHVIEIMIEGLKVFFGQAISIKVESKCFQNRARYHEPTNDKVKKLLLMTAPTETVSIVIPVSIPELGIKDSWVKASGNGRLELDPAISQMVHEHNLKTNRDWVADLVGKVAETTKLQERKALAKTAHETPEELVMSATKVWEELVKALKQDGEALTKIVQVKEIKEDKPKATEVEGDMDRGVLDI